MPAASQCPLLNFFLKINTKLVLPTTKKCLTFPYCHPSIHMHLTHHYVLTTTLLLSCFTVNHHLLNKRGIFQHQISLLIKPCPIITTPRLREKHLLVCDFCFIRQIHNFISFSKLQAYSFYSIIALYHLYHHITVLNSMMIPSILFLLLEREKARNNKPQSEEEEITCKAVIIIVIAFIPSVQPCRSQGTTR